LLGHSIKLPLFEDSNKTMHSPKTFDGKVSRTLLTSFLETSSVGFNAPGALISDTFDLTLLYQTIE
jgi:hypothetical protein